jgi:hypothetical protein
VLRSVLLDRTFGNQGIDLVRMLRVFLEFRLNVVQLEFTTGVDESGSLQDAESVLFQFGVVHFFTIANLVEGLFGYSRLSLAGVAVLLQLFTRCFGLDSITIENAKESFAVYLRRSRRPRQRGQDRGGASSSDLTFLG